MKKTLLSTKPWSRSATLKKMLSKSLEHTETESVLEYEGFYISYPNSLAFVKGFLLKQEALMKKSNLDVETLKLRNGRGRKEEVSKAEKEYVAAKKNFCDFLKKAEYVD